MSMSITFTKLDYIWLSLLIAAIIVFILWLISRRLKRVEIDSFSQEKIKKQWQEIENLLSQDSASAWKLAVLEADKLLDYTLKAIGLPGKDLGERLRAAAYNYSKIREVWPAHKVRNRLVHEAEYQLDKRTARRAVEQFKKALKILRAL